MKESNLIVLAGPSGVGKATVEEHFLYDSDLEINLSISATTRHKRPEEIDGKHYYFLTNEEFQEKIDNDEFVEWAEYVGNLYGTLKSEIYHKLEDNKKVFLEIELIGVRNILKIFPDATTIFLLPPSWEELKKRLINRKTDSKDIIKQRLRVAKSELEQVDLFKYKIINDSPILAGKKIREIILSI